MKSATALNALSALMMLGLGACATTQAGGGINVVTYKKKGQGKYSAPCHKTFAIDAADHRVIGASTTCR